jgi:hypothetical protein
VADAQASDRGDTPGRVSRKQSGSLAPRSAIFSLELP